jgi:hypothetical protein
MCEPGYASYIRLLCRGLTFPVSSSNSGMTPLMWGATDLSRVETFQLLIAANADLAIRDRCNCPYVFVIKPSAYNRHTSLGKTVLGTAIQYHKDHLVDYLRSVGAPV